MTFLWAWQDITQTFQSHFLLSDIKVAAWVKFRRRKKNAPTDLAELSVTFDGQFKKKMEVCVQRWLKTLPKCLLSLPFKGLSMLDVAPGNLSWFGFSRGKIKVKLIVLSRVKTWLCNCGVCAGYHWQVVVWNITASSHAVKSNASTALDVIFG